MNRKYTPLIFTFLAFVLTAGIQRTFAAVLPCATLTDLSALLKTVYDPVITDVQNQMASWWKDLGEGKEAFDGNNWTFFVEMRGNQGGIGARAENAPLPTPTFQTGVQGTLSSRFEYGTFEVTGPAWEASKNNIGAFANAKTREIEGITKNIIKDLNQQAYRSGQGILAVVNASGTSASFTVSSGIHLRIGMIIDIVTIGSAASGTRAGIPISTLTANSDGTMTVTSTGGSGTTVAANDVVARTGTYTSGSNPQVGLDFDGLAGMVDDGTFYGTKYTISRTTFPLFRGQVLGNSGTLRNLTLDLMQQGEDAVGVAGGSCNMIRTNRGQRRKYFDLLSPDKRYMTGRIDGGYERLEYNSKEVTIDDDCPRNLMYFLTKETIQKLILRKLGLMDFDGLVLRQTSGKDAWNGAVCIYGNLLCKQPNLNAVIKDLQEPTGLQQYVG